MRGRLLQSAISGVSQSVTFGVEAFSGDPINIVLDGDFHPPQRGVKEFNAAISKLLVLLMISYFCWPGMFHR